MKTVKKALLAFYVSTLVALFTVGSIRANSSNNAPDELANNTEALTTPAGRN